MFPLANFEAASAAVAHNQTITRFEQVTFFLRANVRSIKATIKLNKSQSF